MFDKNQKSTADLSGKTNRLVEGTTINGDIDSPSDFRLDGILIGNFQSKGKLVIGPSGSVKGEILCQNADIEGKFEGKIHVSELLSIKVTAKIQADMICGKLAVEPGAEFTGTCNMKSSQKNNTVSEQQRAKV